MRSGRARSRSISRSACSLRGGQAKGQGAEGGTAQATIPDDRAAAAAVLAGTDQAERELAGQQLVIGEPPPRRRVDADVRRVLRLVQALQGALKAWPAAAVSANRGPATPASAAAG